MVLPGGTDAFSLFKYFELPNAETTTALANDMTSGSLIGGASRYEHLRILPLYICSSLARPFRV